MAIFLLSFSTENMLNKSTYSVDLGPKSLKMCLRKKWMVPNPG